MAEKTAPKPQMPEPDNTVIKQDDGWYFPAWGIHVAKTVPTIKKTFKPYIKDGTHKIRVTEREVVVHVAKTVEEAKAHIQEVHGINVDKDSPPPRPDSED